MLRDGYFDLPAGKLAAVVTTLEMLAMPALKAMPEPEGISLRHFATPALDWYRDLYRRIGEEWLWTSRLAMPADTLSDIIRHPDIEVWAVLKEGKAEGLMELDFREEGACELSFFGLTQAIIGKGAGRWLMNHAVARAWARGQGAPVKRFWVHTCTIDSQQALPFYIRSGFVPVKRQVEIFDDPRLLGILPKTAAPQAPIIAP